MKTRHGVVQAVVLAIVLMGTGQTSLADARLESDTGMEINDYIDSGGVALLNFNCIWLSTTSCGLHLSRNSTVVWASSSYQFSGETFDARHAWMGSDGNLVVYDEDWNPLFDTDTISAGAFLNVQSDGNLVIYNAAGTVALWVAYPPCPTYC